MSEIVNIAKWDLAKREWRYFDFGEERGRSFSLVDYDCSFDDEKIDYLIFIDGTRVEDHSKDCRTISIKAAGVDKIIDFFDRRNKNVLVKLLLMDADAPIVEESKLLARYMDYVLGNKNISSMNVIGLSKGGALAFNTPKYLVEEDSYNKTNIYTVATPFDGTKIASPKVFSDELRVIIESRFGDGKFANFIYEKIISFYKKISSNSHMYYDIASRGSMPLEYKNLYDPSFIDNIFSDENMEAIQKIRSYKNIVTGIDNNTLKESISNFDFIGVGLCFLNELFFDGKSDGLVPCASQRIIEEKILNFNSEVLESSCHTVTRNSRVMDQLLRIVDEQIDLSHDDNDKGKVKQKRLF